MPTYGHRGLAYTDLMVRLVGPTVLELQGVFLSDWYFETREILDDEDVYPTPALKGSALVQTLPSGPNYPTDNYQRLLVAALYEAHEHVVLTTPYFVPDEPFMQALEVAVRRGVKVDLIVPEHCHQILVGAASRAYYDDLVAVGVNVHLYKPGLLHSKTMSIDRALALIGTGNFDIRSFTLDFEVNLICYGREMTDRLREVQDRVPAGFRAARSPSLEAAPDDPALRPEHGKALQPGPLIGSSKARARPKAVSLARHPIPAPRTHPKAGAVSSPYNTGSFPRRYPAARYDPRSG